MENFVVSARKYRPGTFNSVVGQSHITTTLKNAIQNNHLAQAFLFCGPRGVGKTTCARILAKTINCEHKTEEMEACNNCASCQSFNNNSSMNIHELDAASNNSVDDIRNLVEQVRYAPQSGKYKIYIIDEVHMLSNAAFNAFLKTLEEPPSYAIFILATTEKHKIIPTILSRCQIFDFNRIQVSDISGHLHYIAGQEQIEAEEEALHLIAQKADGALRDALSIFDLIVTFSSGKKVTYQTTIKNLHILDYDYYFKVTDFLVGEEMSQVLLIFDEILKNGFDGHNFIVGLSEHFRNLLVAKDNKTVQLLEVSENVQQKYKEQANAVPLSFLLTALNLASQCDINYKGSKNQRLHVELALMKIAHIPSAVQLAQTREGTLDQEAKKKTTLIKSEAAPNAVEEKAKVASRRATPSVVLPKKTSTPASKPSPPVGSLPKTTKIEGISSLKESIATYQSTPQTKVKAVQDEVVQDFAFTLNQLQKVWSQFAEQLRKEDRLAEFTILKHPYSLGENHLIRLELANAVQEPLIEKLKPELLGFLRRELKNSLIQLETKLVAGDNKKMIYTPQEKLNYLSEKYPQVVELRNRLGLNPDF
ncbi:DNA polymerase III subunit gamma/tau [Xanthovirga aplysinae]|uniref:DNA polymerase III subunit gamma/tau n=1 Tax=Xanthovirga aplysinae TaxID=2529853 RepID=UPI0012BCA526|nr:DNA polymerase III subunit gamma/tau [Xanthovirga aplysinae]MTI30098.1 DNA polymerase III subunit gamma/tau [Xanthovirga aplysinae]